MYNQECKVRPQIVNVNRDEPVSFSFSIKTSKCSDSCNNINNPYAKLKLKFDVKLTLNVKVFNLMSRIRLNDNVCNNKPRWNDDKCRCKCKELIDKGQYDKGFIWNPSNCECKCDNSCDIGEYLDYPNSKCRKN